MLVKSTLLLYRLDEKTLANLPSWNAAGINELFVDIFPIVNPLVVPGPVLDKMVWEEELVVVTELLLFSNLAS